MRSKIMFEFLDNIHDLRAPSAASLKPFSTEIARLTQLDDSSDVNAK